MKPARQKGEFQVPAKVKPLHQRTGDEVWRNEYSGAGAVLHLLEGSGMRVRLTFHDRCVTGLDKGFKHRGICGSAGHLPMIGHMLSRLARAVELRISVPRNEWSAGSGP